MDNNMDILTPVEKMSAALAKTKARAEVAEAEVERLREQVAALSAELTELSAEHMLARQIYAQLVSLVGNSEAERMTSDEVTT